MEGGAVAVAASYCQTCICGWLILPNVSKGLKSRFIKGYRQPDQIAGDNILIEAMSSPDTVPRG